MIASYVRKQSGLIKRLSLKDVNREELSSFPAACGPRGLGTTIQVPHVKSNLGPVIDAEMTQWLKSQN
jgi:hypothetical protein